MNLFTEANSNYLYLALVGILIVIFVLVFWYLKRSRTHQHKEEELAALEAKKAPDPLQGIIEEEDDEDTLTTLKRTPAGEAPKVTAPADEVAVSEDVDEDTSTLEAAPIEEVEEVESVPSRMARLRSRLLQAGGLGRALMSVLSRGDLKASDWEELEDTLLLADLGVEATEELLDSLRQDMKVLGTTDSAAARRLLREKLLKLVDPTLDRSLNLQPAVGEDGQPHSAAVLVVGVNGTGKTTTVGKLARILVAEGKSVILGAADTFRAAAAQQLTTWGNRVGVEVVSSDKEGADPASVAFEAVARANQVDADVVLVDTAGRLQNKATLMDELGKIKRVMERTAPVGEVLLVLDATTGQNGMSQAKVFAQVVDVTGIVLTKLDGSAKGGIVVSVQRELGVPVKLVGLGEGPDDLAPFDVEGFVDALLEE